MVSEPTIVAPKKQRPRKQARLKKRKLAEAGAGAESEDEDSKAAKQHQAQQKPKLAKKPEEQEKPAKKRKRDDEAVKSVGGGKGVVGEKKTRLPKNKRVKAKAQEEVKDTVIEGTEEGEGEAETVEKKEARFIVFIGIPRPSTSVLDKRDG